MLAVFVLNEIIWSAVEEIVSGLVINLESAGAPSGGVIMTELSRAIVVSPVGTFAVLHVFRIGVPLGEVGGAVGDVTTGVVESQEPAIAVVLQPF